MAIEASGQKCKPDTIELFKGSSQYNLLGDFLTDISKGFNAHGYKTVTIDFFDTGWPQQLYKVISTCNIAFYFSMNGHGGNDVILNGKKFEEFANAPMFSFYVDHPCGLISRIDNDLDNQVVSFVDSTHVDFMNTFTETKKPCSKIFIPHGGSVCNKDIVTRPIVDRKIDILFAGSYSDPDNIRKAWLSSNVSALLDAVSESALFESNKPLIQVFVDVFELNGIDTNLLRDRSAWCFLRAVDSYVRAKRRKLVLESFSDLNVQVYGSGWNEFPSSGSKSKIVIKDSINFTEIQDKMADSKIVLNILPYFTDGGHERIFSSMLAGAVCLSDENRYLSANFQNGENILLYNLKDSNYPTRISKFLDDPYMLQDIADKGNEIAKKKHTWSNRAEQILQAVEVHNASRQ